MEEFKTLEAIEELNKKLDSIKKNIREFNKPSAEDLIKELEK